MKIYSDLRIEADHTLVGHPIRILDRRVQRLRTQEVSLVLIQWSRRSPEETTWETEESIRASYSSAWDELVAVFERSGR